jgi:hypothetical protein
VFGVTYNGGVRWLCEVCVVIVDCGLWSIEESQQEILPLSLLSLSAHICINLLMYGT